MKENNKTQFNTKRSKRVPKGPFCFFAWILKVEIVIIIIFLLINIVSAQISGKNKFIMKYNIEKFLYRSIENNDYSVEEIFENLDKNNNLSDEEKVFIKNTLRPEIEENIKHIDTSKVAKRLKYLKTSFNKKYKYNEKEETYKVQNIDMYARKIAGNYNSIFNEINIYEQIDDNDMTKDYFKEKFDFSICDKGIYFHELNHLLTKNTTTTLIGSYTTNLGKEKKTKWWDIFSDSTQIINTGIFLEPINEMFTMEYFKNDMEYKHNDEMIYAYVLAEILPEDVIREYKFYDNQSILISGLLDIDNNIDEVYKLFLSINRVIENQYSEKDFKNIHDGFSYFYEKRYNQKMSEDIEIQLYFYGTKIQTNEERMFIKKYLNMEDYDEIIKIEPKGYFSEDYKNEYNNVYIEYSQNGEIKIK